MSVSRGYLTPVDFYCEAALLCFDLATYEFLWMQMFIGDDVYHRVCRLSICLLVFTPKVTFFI